VFRDKRALVTGHTGFKGAWLSLWLHHLGARVAGFALSPPTHPSLFESLRLAQKIEDRRGDLRDPKTLEQAVAQIQPEFIFHLAAQPLVRRAYRDPIETLESNVLGTAHLLEAVRKSNTPCTIVAVTSDKCYEPGPDDGEYRETDRLGGADPYSASKGCAEIVIASYRRSYFPEERYPKHGIALASARAGNVIGGGDWGEDRLIPDLIRALQSGRPARIRNPRAVRPWQYVLDCLSGYLWLAARLHAEGPRKWAEAWNFGPSRSEAVPVRDLADRFVRLWGSGSWEPSEEEGPAETQYLGLSNEKAAQKLGWRPICDLEETLEKTVVWHQGMDAGRDPLELSTQQMNAYWEKARGEKMPWAADLINR
jgi:CDP-glucose 4,6-dehydratase